MRRRYGDELGAGALVDEVVVMPLGIGDVVAGDAVGTSSAVVREQVLAALERNAHAPGDLLDRTRYCTTAAHAALDRHDTHGVLRGLADRPLVEVDDVDAALDLVPTSVEPAA